MTSLSKGLFIITLFKCLADCVTFYTIGTRQAGRQGDYIGIARTLDIEDDIIDGVGNCLVQCLIPNVMVNFIQANFP